MPGALRGTCYPTLPSAQKHVVGHGNYLRDLFCKKACEMMGGGSVSNKGGLYFPYILYSPSPSPNHFKNQFHRTCQKNAFHFYTRSTPPRHDATLIFMKP